MCVFVYYKVYKCWILFYVKCFLIILIWFFYLCWLECVKLMEKIYLFCVLVVFFIVKCCFFVKYERWVLILLFCCFMKIMLCYKNNFYLNMFVFLLIYRLYYCWCCFIIFFNSYSVKSFNFVYKMINLFYCCEFSDKGN